MVPTFILFDALLQEIQIAIDIFIVGTAACQGVTVGREDDVEGLGIGAKLVALQIAPLGTDGAQRLGAAIRLFHLDRLG